MNGLLVGLIKKNKNNTNVIVTGNPSSVKKIKTVLCGGAEKLCNKPCCLASNAKLFNPTPINGKEEAILIPFRFILILDIKEPEGSDKVKIDLIRVTTIDADIEIIITKMIVIVFLIRLEKTKLGCLDQYIKNKEKIKNKFIQVVRLNVPRITAIRGAAIINRNG